jgi:hypothetical protein
LPDEQLLAPPRGRLRVFSSPLPLRQRLEYFYVKSIRLGNWDVLNDGLHLQGPTSEKLTIVIGSNPGSLEGRVVDARKQPVPGVWVALVPESGLRFHVEHKFTATDSRGRFQLQSLPPGEYKAFAWEGEAQEGDWQNPSFMRNYENLGTPLHIEEGRMSTVEISPASSSWATMELK